MTCPECGASNPANAAWCNLCARPFSSAVITEDPVPEPAPAAAPRPTSRAGVWACAACDTENPLEADRCSACGTSIFDSFGRGDVVSEQRETAAARAWVPGWGHAALGDMATAAMVVATLVVGVVLGVLLALAPGTAIPGVVCLLGAAATWGAAVVDVRRRVAGGPGLLTGRRVLVAAIAIVVVAFGAFVGAIDG